VKGEARGKRRGIGTGAGHRTGEGMAQERVHQRRVHRKLDKGKFTASYRLLEQYVTELK